MSEISDNEKKKLVAIMETYGVVYSYTDDTEHCLMIGNTSADGFYWTYEGRGGNRFDREPLDISPVVQTYLALEDVLLNTVEMIQEENDASYKFR